MTGCSPREDRRGANGAGKLRQAAPRGGTDGGERCSKIAAECSSRGGRRGNIVKKTAIRGYSDFEDYVFVKTPKIPDSRKDFYAKVALSDYMLEKAVQENYRYAGQVKETQLGYGIEAGDSAGAYDLWAIQYAYDNPGACGRRKIYSLETILNDPELLYRHLKNVQGLYPEKYYNDNKVITENGYREISEDDNQRT